MATRAGPITRSMTRAQNNKFDDFTTAIYNRYCYDKQYDTLMDFSMYLAHLGQSLEDLNFAMLGWRKLEYEKYVKAGDHQRISAYKNHQEKMRGVLREINEHSNDAWEEINDLKNVGLELQRKLELQLKVILELQRKLDEAHKHKLQ